MRSATVTIFMALGSGCPLPNRTSHPRFHPRVVSHAWLSSGGFRGMRDLVATLAYTARVFRASGPPRPRPFPGMRAI